MAPTFTPASLSFGSQAVDTTSAAKSVTIKNTATGDVVLDFTNFAVNPPFAISANNCGATLGSGGKSCKVSITFTPTALGAVNGAFSVSDNAPGSPQTVPLSGTGIVQTTLTPSSLTFAKQKVGTTSAAKNVTLKNNLPTTLTGISYSAAAPFAVSTSTCGTTLATKASCTISVTFSPTTTGIATGTLSVNDSADNSPQTVSLTGTGD
ncbi:MAG TPA: choice-of-anchor D domain-containing protein [Candidatus Sulfotelmatobacter sp.]